MAPPGKRMVAGWVMLALLAGVVCVLALGTQDAPGVGAGAGAALLVLIAGVALAVRARRYNAVEHPARLRDWARSVICARCGEVYAASE